MVTKGINGHNFYLDFDRIKKNDGYIYIWELIDLSKPKYGYLSGKLYKQVDCRIFRFKILSFVHHNQSMGKDTGDSSSPENPEWQYPSPESVDETLLNSICRR